MDLTERHENIKLSLITPMLGRKFNMLTVIDAIPERNREGNIQYLCKCDCGEHKIVCSRDLLSKEDSKYSCGCTRRVRATYNCKNCNKTVVSGKRSRNRNGMCNICYLKDNPIQVNYRTKSSAPPFEVGSVFGKLTVMSVTDRPSDVKETKRLRYYPYFYKCACTCGKVITVWHQKLDLGRAVNCGCLEYKDGMGFLTEKTFKVYRKSALVRGLDFAMTIDEFRSIIFECCTYCGEAPTKSRTYKTKKFIASITSHGVDRVNSAIGYVPGNIVPCCATCNRLKGDLTYEAFITHVRKIGTHTRNPVFLPPNTGSITSMEEPCTTTT